MRAITCLSVLAVAGVAFAGNGVLSIPDVRVAPLLQTRWGQTTDTGYDNKGDPCFNYYTPDQAPCGCSAAAMAQIIRYWQHPANAPAGNYVCAIEGVSQSLPIVAGAYDWAAMPVDTRGGIPEAERQAIGKLTYDCAVALHTWFGPTESSAYSDAAFSILTGTFGYANAMGYCPNGGIPFEDVQGTIFASLDFGLPVIASLLTADGAGHQVLIDGYGFDGQTPYVHILFGWPAKSDLCDSWYVLPDVKPGNETPFTQLDGIIYNIIPSASGDILSGRVTDENGSPIPEAKVTAHASGLSVGVKTDANGIYAFILPGGKDYQISCGRMAKTVSLPKSESAVCSWKNPLMPSFSFAGSCGNSWGNDLRISSTPEPEDALGPFRPTKAVSGVYPYCGAVYDSDGAACGTVSLKIGKPSKKDVSKVSGTITLLDGKKYTIKSTDFPVNAGGSTTVAGIEVKNLGTIDLSVGENGFLATIMTAEGTLSAVTADLSKGLPAGAAVFSLKGVPETLDGYAVLTTCLPDGQIVTVSPKGKWDCGKAPSIKYKKVTVKDPETGVKITTYELQGVDDPTKPNKSGLKLTYTAKTGTFKGSFYIYTDVGTPDKPKLKKTKATVNGVVVDGRGVGLATAKEGKVAYSWSVAVN